MSPERSLPGKIIKAGVLLSSLYILESGLPQPGHILLLAGAIAYILKFRESIQLDKATSILALFSSYTIISNAIHGIALQSDEFINPMIFITYNFIIFIAAKSALEKKTITSDYLFFAFTVAFAIQIALFITGLGRSIENIRFSGSFNDPNQMAYWFICLGSAYLLTENRNISPSAFKISATCIMLAIIASKSASRSALLGLTPLFLFSIHTIITRTPKKYSRKIIIALAAAFLALPLVQSAKNTEKLSTIERMKNSNFQEEANIRGYSRITGYPEQLIIGAGEGLHERFTPTKLEIHSTWAGVLFYYGIPGSILIISTIAIIARKITIPELILFTSPLAYGISTYGLRTPIFWFLLATYAGLAATQIDRKKPTLRIQ